MVIMSVTNMEKIRAFLHYERLDAASVIAIQLEEAVSWYVRENVVFDALEIRKEDVTADEDVLHDAVELLRRADFSIIMEDGYIIISPYKDFLFSYNKIRSVQKVC